MYVTQLSDTSFDDFGLKVIQLDSQTISSVLLTDYEWASPGVGQFSFHGLEYGAIADELYLARVEGDSLYKIDMSTGQVSAVMGVPFFDNTYSYLHTFYQSEQRYAMIVSDASFQKRFVEIDIDDDTVYVSPPMTFSEPLRGLEVSEQTGEYFVVSDADQTFYKIDPSTGALLPQFPIPNYQNAFGYLHTFDFSTDQYLMVGMDSMQNLSLFSILPASNTVSQVPFPVPVAGYFGLEATNTLFIARMLEDLVADPDPDPDPNPTTSIDEDRVSFPFELYPNPSADHMYLKWDEQETLQIELLDIQGKRHLTRSFERGQSINIQVSELPPGQYLLHVQAPRISQRWYTWIAVE